MINCMLDEGKGSVYIRGSITDIMADVSILISRIYEGLNDEHSKYAFKMFVKDLLPEVTFASSEELDDLRDKYKEYAKESKENFNNSLKELKKLLHEISLEEEDE